MEGLGGMKYIGGAESQACEVRRSTLTQRLKDRKENLETQLNRVNEVLTVLEKNPEMQNVIDLIYGLGIYGLGV